MSAGKGDKPRNCFSKEYKNNYENIDWNKNSHINTEIKRNNNFKILPNKICPTCSNEVRFNFKACGHCGYEFKYLI